MCKTGQPHRWQATVSDRSNGARCPYNTGRAVCPCNDLAQNHQEVAAEWDWEANGERAPETVTASSNTKAAWRCRLCGHKWSTHVHLRTFNGTGCPRCAREARRQMTRQPSISCGPPHLLAEWDRDANESQGWRPDKITLGSNKKVHWVVKSPFIPQSHRSAASGHCTARELQAHTELPDGKGEPDSLRVSGDACRLCTRPSLHSSCTPHSVTSQSMRVVYWKRLDGRHWQQSVDQVVSNVRREMNAWLQLYSSSSKVKRGVACGRMWHTSLCACGHQAQSLT